MGRPAATPTYRDDASLDDAVSLHTTRGDYDYDDVPRTPGEDEEPPAYTDTPASTSTPAAAPQGNEAVWDQYPVIERPTQQYILGKPVVKGAVTARLEPRLSSDPSHLHHYVHDILAVLPPRPVIQIRGHHTETVRRDNKTEKNNVTDFDIMLNLQAYLGPPHSSWRTVSLVTPSANAYRGRFRKSRAPGYKQDVEVGDDDAAAALSLGEWCQQFCAAPARLKVFRLSRSVSGIDEQALRSRIETLIRGTHYRGHVDIFFPLEDRAVDIYSNHAVNRWRNTSWIRWLFYLSFLWILAWPLLFFLTKRWAVVEVDWAFSRPSGDGTAKTYATVSEAEWFEKHRGILRNLVLEGHRGDVSGVDAATPRVARSGARQQQGFRSGNDRVDGMVGFLRAGAAAVSAVRTGFQGDLEGWGGDC